MLLEGTETRGDDASKLATQCHASGPQPARCMHITSLALRGRRRITVFGSGQTAVLPCKLWECNLRGLSILPCVSRILSRIIMEENVITFTGSLSEQVY